MKAKTVLTIGFFDGVHSGHRKIIETLIHQSKENVLSSVLLTFDRPAHRDIKLLNTLEEKIEILKTFPLDKVKVIRFDRKFAMTSPADFFHNVLINKFNVCKIIAGYDFAFGRRRSGDIDTLKCLCKENNVELIVVEPVKMDKTIISSSHIRKLLLNGKIESANELLGRFYSLKGKVVKGRRIGKKIGFPTANIKVSLDKLVPSGVFSGCVHLGNSLYSAVADIGYRPTFKREPKSVKTEVHIIGFSGNILNRTIEFFFFQKLRDEKKFKNINELKNQIERDVENVKKIHYN